MPKIRTITTITITQDIPYTNEYYPGETLAEAVQYEEQLPRADVIGYFVESLEFLEDDKIQVSRKVALLENDGHHRMEAIKDL